MAQEQVDPLSASPYQQIILSIAQGILGHYYHHKNQQLHELVPVDQYSTRQ